MLASALAFATAAGCRRSPPIDGGVADAARGDATLAAATSPADLARAAPPSTPVVPVAPTPDQAGDCPARDDESVGLLVSPLHPVIGTPVRVLAATLADAEPLALRLETTKGEPIEAELVQRSGTPSLAVAKLAVARPSEVRAVVGRHGRGLRCLRFRIAPKTSAEKPRAAQRDAVWPVTHGWNRGEEALYSAWIREMFHAPRGEELAYNRLDEVTSQSERNLLFDYYGWSEDGPSGLKLKPDCADAPYFLRAYFAWKRGLPFAYRQCSSGDDGHPPRCQKPRSVLDPPDVPAKLPDDWNELAQVRRFFQRSVSAVHSGNGRVPFDDDESDFYGLELTRRALRPGAVYADPYGHVFVVLEFLDPDGTLPGVLYAVDGQPDGSITRKRFWEGNFLWNPDPALGGSGFKAFRPLALKTEDGGRVIESLRDAQIGTHPDYGDVSHAQAKLGPSEFYDTMDRVITPSVRDPFKAQEEIVRALSESAKVRVTSVNNADRFFAEHPDGVIVMPEGGEIFETAGPWEDFSTPARDLRLLIAMDVVNHFDAKIVRQPDAFGAATGKGMDELLTRLAAERTRLLASDDLAFSYKRSDGSAKKLTLADLVARAPAFEAAYNPNDCPEHRWGAPPGSDEASTCRRHAPDDQRSRMDGYRAWFRERKRPARGHP
jgi:hypothetical protein